MIKIIKNNLFLYISIIFFILFFFLYFNYSDNGIYPKTVNTYNENLDIYEDTNYLYDLSSLTSSSSFLLNSNVKSITIDKYNIYKEVLAVGLNEKGEIDVKGTIDDLVWYARTGDNVTNIIIAGHRTWGNKKGVLYGSEFWEKGLEISILFDNGESEIFELSYKYKYSPEETPLEIMNTEEGIYRVTIITCDETGSERFYNIFTLKNIN